MKDKALFLNHATKSRKLGHFKNKNGEPSFSFATGHLVINTGTDLVHRHMDNNHLHFDFPLRPYLPANHI